MSDVEQLGPVSCQASLLGTPQGSTLEQGCGQAVPFLFLLSHLYLGSSLLSPPP